MQTRTAMTMRTWRSKHRPALSQNMLQAAAVCLAAAVLMLTHNARKRSLHHGKESHTVRQLMISWPPAISPLSVSAPVTQAQQLDSPAGLLANQQADRHSIRVSVLPTISGECDWELQASLLRMLPGAVRWNLHDISGAKLFGCA